MLYYIGFVLYCVSVGVKKLVRSYRSSYFFSRMGQVGRGCRLGYDVNITGLECIYLGNNVHINDGARIAGEGGLFVGDNVHVARNCTIYTHNHNYEGACLPYDDTHIYKPVRIEKNVWIGVNVTIVPGTIIGEGAIIGAGTVVYGNVPAFSIVGSAPWRILKKRNIEHYHNLDKAKRYGGINGRPLRLDSSGEDIV
ncbi:hypothetical protein AWN76_009180 [Rhodothermaceae bacterium RA]|nr:hypothetical protein AWN76_009180 [Rhodothermaceae bacterium RA]